MPQGKDTILPAMPKGRIPEVVVVGGGIVGAFATYFLARRGIQATLLERGRVGGEASGNNAGNLAPLEGPGIPGPMQPFALESFELHREHAAAIEELSGVDVTPRCTTRLHAAFDEQDLIQLGRVKETYDTTPGFAASWLDREALVAAEPRVGREIGNALSVEGNARVEGGRYTRAIVAAAEALGATTLRAEVRGLRHRGGRVAGVDLASGSLDCGAVILAPGPWCADPARWLGTAVPVEPVKGELLLVEPPGGGVRADLVGGNAALYGTGGTSVWLGQTEDRVGFDRAATPEARNSILAGAATLLTDVRHARVLRQTVGLRPVTPDGFPIVGAPPGWENVCLAVGGGRKGMLLSSGMGLAAAELITEGATAVTIGPCSPERWRDGQAA
jgi:glycine oxidase